MIAITDQMSMFCPPVFSAFPLLLPENKLSGNKFLQNAELRKPIPMLQLR